MNKTQLPFWGFNKHFTFDVVNYLIYVVNIKGLTDLFAISRFECSTFNFTFMFFWCEKKNSSDSQETVNSLIFFQDRLRHSKCMCKYFKPFEHVISYQSITWNKVLALAKVRNADFVVNISLLQSTLLLHTSKVY